MLKSFPLICACVALLISLWTLDEVKDTDRMIRLHKRLQDQNNVIWDQKGQINDLKRELSECEGGQTWD
jgi:hypothetical protein